MSIPTEIVEKILANCDGKSLLIAKQVCKQWREIVEYLSKKTQIWKWCCYEEIPKKELTQYLNSYNKEDKDVWFFVYNNWWAWEHIPRIMFETVLCPAEIPRITCIDVFCDYIAVGSEDGRVRIYDQYWKPLSISRHQAERVTKVTFMYSGPPHHVLKIVIAYPRMLFIDDLFGNGYTHMTIEDVTLHSVYKEYICYQKHIGRMTIEKLTGPAPDNRFLTEVWFTRIYSPNYISCINMWDGICTILINDDVRKVDYYTKSIVPISSLPKALLVNFSLHNSLLSHVHRILRDDIIVVLYRADSLGNEYMEVVLLEKYNTYSKKLFNTSEIFEATITCLFLYGHTFIIGVDSGMVYFYHVPSWKHFNIKDYQKRVIIGKHPITNIAVRETKRCRKFYITSSFNIHEVTGFSVF